MTVYITRFHNGAGLGDAIVQINWVYRLAKRLECSYLHQPIRSGNHLRSANADASYDQILGLHLMPAPVLSADLPVIEIRPDDIEALPDTLAHLRAARADALLQIHYPYREALHWCDAWCLRDLPAFPWLSCRRAIRPAGEPVVPGLVALHVRLGDSMAYPLPGQGPDDDRVFDARRRCVTRRRDLPLHRQWSLADVRRAALAALGTMGALGARSQGLQLQVMTDGIGTALKLLESTRLRDLAGVPVDDLRAAVLDTWAQFEALLKEIGAPPRDSDLSADLDLLISAERIVWTDGVFARKVNQYLRAVPAPIHHVTEAGSIEVPTAATAVAPRGASSATPVQAA